MLKNYLKKLCFLLFPYFVVGCIYVRNELRALTQRTYTSYDNVYMIMLLCIGIGLFVFFWTCVRLDKKDRRIIEFINVVVTILLYLNFRFVFMGDCISMNTYISAKPIALIYIGFTAADFAISLLDDYRIKKIK